MPLHSTKVRPQRDYTAAASVQLGHHLPREIVATSAEVGRVVALWAALCAMERHFGGNQAHMHTKQSRQ